MVFLKCSWAQRFVFCAGLALFAGLFQFYIYTGDRNFPSSDKIQSGDIIFIRGKSLRSAIVNLIEGNYHSYSHVGLVVLENGAPFIIHADPAAANRVTKEPWSSVISHKRISAASVFRITGSPMSNISAIQASITAQQFWKDALPFDHEFDMATPKKLYCTELIWRAYMSAGINLTKNSFKSNRRYLLPSDLIKSEFLRKVL